MSSRKNNIIFFFGLSGSGKTYLGNELARLSGWFHYNADDDVTDEMKKALANSQPFSEKMRDDFFEIVALKSKRLSKIHQPLIISQAAYKQKHRDYLQQQLAPLTIEFVHVHADDQTLQHRIQQRGKIGKGIAEQSAQALKNDFEWPCTEYAAINNSTSANIHDLLELIINPSL
jgi:gluconokinase